MDAADAELGQPVVSNGLSLCTLHHRSYDRGFMGITPDYEVRIDPAMLEEIDGPMLRHGLQDMHTRTLDVPTRRADRPDRARLAWRWEKFVAASA